MLQFVYSTYHDEIVGKYRSEDKIVLKYVHVMTAETAAVNDRRNTAPEFPMYECPQPILGPISVRIRIGHISAYNRVLLHHKHKTFMTKVRLSTFELLSYSVKWPPSDARYDQVLLTAYVLGHHSGNIHKCSYTISTSV